MDNIGTLGQQYWQSSHYLYNIAIAILSLSLSLSRSYHDSLRTAGNEYVFIAAGLETMNRILSNGEMSNALSVSSDLSFIFIKSTFRIESEITKMARLKKFEMF